MSLDTDVQLREEEKIECVCDDLSCPKTGTPSEVDDHIDECPCFKCHVHFG